ncbi:hypothetical protein LWI28_013559 [Acer negundo]|uniref:Uncharacterized protein n=1 Tax=Acer negundo TaxID=4023 RepID=A0AAD5J9D1_ACENE|nr:hypothetical protein LWI28_013559 [Acer negundo]
MKSGSIPDPSLGSSWIFMKNPSLPPYPTARTISCHRKNPASSPATPSPPVDRATPSPPVDRTATSPPVNRATPAPSMAALIVQLQLFRWRRRSRSCNPFDDGEYLLLHLASLLFLAPIMQLQLLWETDNFFFVPRVCLGGCVILFESINQREKAELGSCV